MWELLARWHQRGRALDQGVDADLVRTNRRRWRACLYFFGCFFALGGLQSVLKLSGMLDRIAIALTIVCFISGMILGQWARAESAFLNKPDPKEPPRLWK